MPAMPGARAKIWTAQPRSKVRTPGSTSATTRWGVWLETDEHRLSDIWCSVAPRASLPAMNTIVGIRIPDSELARDARELALELSPDFLLAHVDRTYVFGALATARAGLAVDEEIAYVAAILHDLGLTDRHGGERRFEVDGAEEIGRAHV